MKRNDGASYRERVLHLFLSVLFSMHFAVAQDSISLTPVFEYETTPVPMMAAFHDEDGLPYLYAANKEGGIRIFDISDIENQVLIATIGIDQLLDMQVMNLSQHGRFLYAPLGSFFTQEDVKGGLAIIDVNDPKAPLVRDIWIASGTKKGSAIAISDGDYAYLGAMNAGVFILDVRDKDDIRPLSGILPNPDFPIENPNFIQEPNARGMAIVEPYLVLCNDAGGIRLIDIQDKTAPVEVDMYINQQALTTQQAYNNIDVFEDWAFVATDYCGMEILDISALPTVERVGWWNPFRCEIFDSLWIESPIHTNHIQYAPNHDLVFLSAADRELAILDVSDKTQPKLVAFYGIPDNLRGTWGASVSEHYVFLSYTNAVVPFVSFFSGIVTLSWDRITSTFSNDLLVDRLDVWPIPFQDRLHVRVDSDRFKPVEVRLLDLYGRIVVQGDIEAADAAEWPLPILPAGMYVLEVRSDQQSAFRKVIRS